jgi:hypothetical protein
MWVDDDRNTVADDIERWSCKKLPRVSTGAEPSEAVQRVSHRDKLCQNKFILLDSDRLNSQRTLLDLIKQNHFGTTGAYETPSIYDATKSTRPTLDLKDVFICDEDSLTTTSVAFANLKCSTGIISFHFVLSGIFERNPCVAREHDETEPLLF